jgi:hypothetical protein
MSLWDLPMAICFVMAISAALAAAKHTKVGLGGYALAITIGLALGFGCAGTKWTAAELLPPVSSAIPNHCTSDISQASILRRCCGSCLHRLSGLGSLRLYFAAFSERLATL